VAVTVSPKLSQKKIWRIGSRDQAREEILVKELAIDPIVAAILVQRGISDPEEAERFIDPRLEDLHAPSLLPDYRAAVDAILGARERGETVYVHGDYDVDGVTSAALFTRFLTRLGLKVIPHVPHRMKEGFGIHLDAVRWAKDQGAHLFLTCDCGSSAIEQIEAVREAGMAAVVTDHHSIGEAMPRAEAFVNPHRKDSHYPFQELSGVGVVLKLCAGIAEEAGYRTDQFYRAFLDLAVLGTVCDVMPLLGENRIITRHGLLQLAQTKKPGLKALLAVCDLDGRDKTIDSRSLGFQLGPRINAVGRIDDSGVALDMLLTEDYDEAYKIARQLDDLNRSRQDTQKLMAEEAVEMIDRNRLYERSVIVVAKEGWHSGIVGIVAGKIVEAYHRPAFVVALSADGTGKGSARSIPGFDLAAAIDAHRHLIGGGGHQLAAGINGTAEGIAEFATEVAAYADTILSEDDLTPKVDLDLELNVEDGTRDLAYRLKVLEPFGDSNAKPTFMASGLEISSISDTRNPEHVRVQFVKDGVGVEAMAFGLGTRLRAVDTAAKLDVACEMDLSSYRGSEQFKWIVRDFRTSE